MKLKRIKELRKTNNLTQQEVANILGCNPGTYRRYENGTRDLPLSMAIKLAMLYDVSLNYLVELSDKKNLSDK